MATRYRLRRKTFGFVDAAGNAVSNTVGTAAETTGKVLSTKAAGVAGGLMGSHLLGGAIGTMTGLGPIGSKLIGYGLGKAATTGIGSGLKTLGQDLQT